MTSSKKRRMIIAPYAKSKLSTVRVTIAIIDVNISTSTPILYNTNRKMLKSATRAITIMKITKLRGIHQTTVTSAMDVMIAAISWSSHATAKSWSKNSGASAH